MLRLFDKCFKTAVIEILKCEIPNSLRTNESLREEIVDVKGWKFKTKKCNNQSFKILVDRFNNSMRQ